MPACTVRTLVSSEPRRRGDCIVLRDSVRVYVPRAYAPNEPMHVYERGGHKAVVGPDPRAFNYDPAPDPHYNKPSKYFEAQRRRTRGQWTKWRKQLRRDWRADVAEEVRTQSWLITERPRSVAKKMIAARAANFRAALRVPDSHWTNAPAAPNQTRWERSMDKLFNNFTDMLATQDQLRKEGRLDEEDRLFPPVPDWSEC